jgi:hypothetical protein
MTMKWKRKRMRRTKTAHKNVYALSYLKSSLFCLLCLTQEFSAFGFFGMNETSKGRGWKKDEHFCV